MRDRAWDRTRGGGKFSLSSAVARRSKAPASPRLGSYHSQTLRSLGSLLLATLFSLTACGGGVGGSGGSDGGDTTPTTYVVSFDANCASATPNPINAVSGNTISAPSVPVWTGNVFDGWYNGNTQWDFGSTPVTSNITLTAKWQETTSEVQNYYDFGSCAPTVTTYDITDATTFGVEANAGNYAINITSDVDVGSVYIQPADNSVVSLRGGGTIHKSSGVDAYLFSLTKSDSKLILRNATLKGHSGNTRVLVYLGDSSVSFDMLGGTISGNNNTAAGVRVGSGAFTMKGGTISGNSSVDRGGGVYVYNGSFVKTGGTIYGKTPEGAPNWNRAGSDSYGHAVHCNSGTKIRNSTAGEDINLSSSTTDNWE